MKLALICKHCKNTQLYETKSEYLTGKRKTCVYCGKSFLVKNGLLKRMDNPIKANFIKRK